MVDESAVPVLTGDLATSPAVYTHNKVTVGVRNTAGVPLALNELRLSWVNPLARLYGVRIGDNMTTPEEIVWGTSDVQPVITAFSTPTTTLSLPLAAGDVTIPVASTAALPMSGVVGIGSEMIAYNGKTAASLQNCVRGIGPTVADAHLMGDQVHFRGVFTTLTGDLAAADATAFVGGTTNFTASGSIYIQGEKIDYAALGAGQFSGLSRGTGGTVAADHPAGTVVYQVTAAVSGCTGGATGGLLTPTTVTLAVPKELRPLDGEIPVELFFGNESGCADSNADMREDQLELTFSYTNTSTGSACATVMTLDVPSGPVAGNVIQDQPENPTFAWAVPGYGGSNTKDNVLVGGDTRVTVQSNVFFPVPGSSTTLSAAIDAAAGTLPVYSTSGFTDAGTLVIGGEQVTYTGRDATNFTGCTRGANATPATGHNLNDLVYSIINPETVDLYYYCDPGGTLQEPPFNQLPTLYTQLPMRRVSGSLWRLYDVDPIDGQDHRIPACNNSSVWYYLLAKDSDGNFDREPELQAGAFQYFQQEGDPCNTWPGMMDAPTLTEDPLSNTITLTWTRPTTNNDGSAMTDLAGYRVMREQRTWSEAMGGWTGWIWSEVASIDDPDVLTWTDASADLLTTRNSYYLRPFDSCITPHEGWSAGPFPWECLGDGAHMSVSSNSPNWWDRREFLSCNPSTNAPTQLWYLVDVCRAAGDQLWSQTCSRDGGDYDPVRLKWSGWEGQYNIDGDFYGGRWFVATYKPGQCDYPGAPTALDLKVDADGVDQIRINVFAAGSPEPGEGFCGGLGVIGSKTIDVGPVVEMPPQIDFCTWDWNLWIPNANQTTPPQVRTFQLKNSGGGTLNYTITTSEPWVTVSPSSGSAIFGECDEITVTIDPTGLSDGMHNFTITISDPAATNSPRTMLGQVDMACNPCLSPVTPGAPTNLVVTPPMGSPSCNGYAANLTWAAPAMGGTCNDQVTGYEVYRCMGDGCDPLAYDPLNPAPGSAKFTTPSNSFTDSTPFKLSNKVYRWAVKAVNAACGLDRKVGPSSGTVADLCNN